MAKVGFIGLGIMGKPMVTNLYKTGMEVLVNDVNEEIAHQLEKDSNGLVKLVDKETMGRECEVVMCILPTADIVDNVLFGEGGVAFTMKEGSVFVDFSSETAGQSKDHAEKLAKYGIKFLDAPNKLDVDKKKISMESEIKAFGTFSFELKLHNGVIASMKVMVTE